ncbi:MAG: hypothetical protein H6830_07905 [Planctomycetes bacterium]|nr:hypothetical protein [Planctomycetota bacterium]MCB9907625.1 hypothetical protein [Planctomycetota bacterium]MCB9909800.1 hypothetical protein [Planctomycetota bacterium]MCB9912291.1 hypothetical protein [Planctomycetota bacterium]HPF12730.1 hypothetical protein [Planctomycetota bacterium]
MATLPPGSGSRIAIVGCSGAGKSHLARQLSARLGLPHVELDGLFHQANWEPLETLAFQAHTRERTPADGAWVACGNYHHKVGQSLLARATHIVFLDYPKHIVMGRMLGRSLGRVATRQVLWNGNRERWRNLLHLDPEKNIVLWAWVRWGHYRVQYRALVESEAWAHAQVWHLRHPKEAEALLALVVPGHEVQSLGGTR